MRAATRAFANSFGPTLILTVFGVTTSRESPPREMSEPRLTDIAALPKTRPSSESAASTVVEVTQWVSVSPSTLSSSGRP